MALKAATLYQVKARIVLISIYQIPPPLYQTTTLCQAKANAALVSIHQIPSPLCQAKEDFSHHQE